MPEELRERAKARAEQEGKTVSALAREAFEHFLRTG
ncbi:putative DNA-binding protein [Planotetraspora sp. GP83]